MKKFWKILSAVMVLLIIIGTHTNVHAYPTPDAYESNDTWQTATNYSSMTTINSAISHTGSLFTLGFKSANLTTPSDVDWYKNTFGAGQTILADIKNLGGANYDFEIYFAEGGGVTKLENVNVITTSSTEKYARFITSKAGVYYMKVFSNGDDSNSYYYIHFEVNNEKVFNISNLNLGGSQIYGSTYRGLTYDLRNYFPSGSKIYTLYVNDYLVGSSQQVDKKITTNAGGVYYSIGYNGEMGNMYQVNLAQQMTIQGKTTSGNTYFWAPVLNGKFKWTVQPHAGY